MSAAETASGALLPDIEQVQKKAAGSTFYLAIQLMPKAQRDAMLAIYTFCRAVDDIADDEGMGPRTERHDALVRWRDDLDALYDNRAPAQSAFLREAIERYDLRKEDFLAVIDGMEMDVAEDIRAPDLSKLDLYCDRVASAVGRLSVKVFGMEDGPGFELAHHLGRALQLTNILRDLDEDAGMGRLYLPREYLRDSGVTTGDPIAAISDPAVDGACRKVAALAREHYQSADRVFRARPNGLTRTPKLMAAVYAEILREMEAAGWVPPRRRVRVGKGKLLRIVVTSGLLG